MSFTDMIELPYAFGRRENPLDSPSTFAHYLKTLITPMFETDLKNFTTCRRDFDFPIGDADVFPFTSRSLPGYSSEYERWNTTLKLGQFYFYTEGYYSV